jgi:phospholipid-binding lipoprotein MlaA
MISFFPFGRPARPSFSRLLMPFAAALVLALGATFAAAETPRVRSAEAAWQELLMDPAFLVPASARLPEPAATPAQLRRDPPPAEHNDPYERVNRYAHEFNTFLRINLLDPVTQAYLDLTSPPVQKGVANVFANLREPITVASNLLLGDLDGATEAGARFVINTTIGLGGYHDPATEQGYPRKVRTLEEVLCRYGVPEGPYVVLPVLGPATVRDAVGRITTLVTLYGALGPVYVPYRLGDIAVQYVDRREQLRFVESLSIDPYASVKSAHLQISRMTCDERTDAQIQLFGQ